MAGSRSRSAIVTWRAGDRKRANRVRKRQSGERARCAGGGEREARGRIADERALDALPERNAEEPERDRDSTDHLPTELAVGLEWRHVLAQRFRREDESWWRAIRIGASCFGGTGRDAAVSHRWFDVRYPSASSPSRATSASQNDCTLLKSFGFLSRVRSSM